MATDFLAVRNAESHVRSYNDVSTDLMSRHAEAMDCRNCEAFLQMGIDAFDWLRRADREIRLNFYRNEAEFDLQATAALAKLCEVWQEPVAFAEKWIAIQQQRGGEIDNLVEFRHCVEEMAAIVEANAAATEDVPESIATLRDLAIQENHDGQTAEFI